MSTVLVTGGSGFVGAHLVRRLLAGGHAVRALARSDDSAAALERAGAEPVPGNVCDPASLATAARGCGLAFHCAARVGDWGPRKEYVSVNVEGTRNVLAACAAAGVRRLVHCSSEAVLVSGPPLLHADETWPLRPRSRSVYAATKAQAELVLGEASGIETVAVRPGFVWGPGDRTIRPLLAQAVRDGRFVWVGGGRHLISTTHVANVVEGLVLAAARGRAGEAYHVSDGDDVPLRAFATDLLATAGVVPPGRSLPFPVARGIAAVGESVWRALRLRGQPPLTRTAVWFVGLERTVSIEKARRELGYEPVVSRAEGLAQLFAE